MRKIFIYFVRRIIPEKLYLKIIFKKKLGYNLDIKNPKTFNEKLQWLKLNDRTSLHSKCADKYEVREYVKNKIGQKYLIPLIMVTEDINDIKPENLPDYPVIIKTNHDSGTHFIIWDKKSCDWKSIKKKLIKSLNTNFYYTYKEWQYKNIRPKIIVEKLLGSDDNLPNDIKVFCFNGTAKIISVCWDRLSDVKWLYFDINGNELPFNCEMKLDNDAHYDEIFPENTNELARLAENLASEFIFVRVDFYVFQGNIYFGEMTFHPISGLGNFDPQEWDRKLGDMIKI